jgi:hypothetical protein
MFPPAGDRLPGVAAVRAGAGLPLFTCCAGLGQIAYKTGSRRRADLTRLALQAGMV